MTKLAEFIVLERLRVGDIQIEPRRVSAVYEVEHPDGQKASARLIYSYHEKLFNKKDPSDVNLASMMLAQVAFNYGLFCKELVFDGLFDHIDQEFIKYMIENTSREILTNKLLIKNEFLVKPYDDLQFEKREKYTQAKLIFTNALFTDAKLAPRPVKTDISKYAILSSGGKDSLLSYGIIKEFGEPHPVFVNEAGRHWFTAVNAYRHFKTVESNTMKVWCNSDRIFNWMLKHLKFIRKDYVNVRADIYPVRLWTVAVFLFGVLPVALKKGMANIIIGDEYDTTVKKNLNGILNYSALYDQSKYFDNALSRYYQKKRWNMYQYSMLRSLSEILIMKILLKRYPELQKHQMSCHAAHEKNQRMYPCGNCEKCRRIIGMIKGLGEDPVNCGYSNAQIEKSLNMLTYKPVKQIGSDAAQLFHLLLTQGLIEDNEASRKNAKEHPQVMKIRFDKERSNLEDMPGHIRIPLFNILQQYAVGAVEMTGKKWQEIEINEQYLNSKPYKIYANNE